MMTQEELEELADMIANRLRKPSINITIDPDDPPDGWTPRTKEIFYEPEEEKTN